MKANIMKIRKASNWVATFFLAALFSSGAHAATRTAYFNQSAQNKTTNGLANPGGQSYCRITISNPSNVAQQVTALKVSITSLDSWNGGDAGTPQGGAYSSLTNTTGVTGASCSTDCAATLAAGSSVTFVFAFTAYPPKSGGVTAGYQKLRCSGSIVAVDSGQPGFLVATGVLVSFVESTKISTDGITMGSPTDTEFGGMAVYTQVPISINRGKPF